MGRGQEAGALQAGQDAARFRGATTSPIAPSSSSRGCSPTTRTRPSCCSKPGTRAIEQHYAQGLRLYQEEKLAEAISEWRLVLDLDPEHANAKKNLDQAEKLQKALDLRKKK